MSDKPLTEQETQQLLERLQQLPTEVSAPDRWPAIQAAIEQDKQHIAAEPQAPVDRRRFWQPMVAAAVLLVVFSLYTIAPWQQSSVPQNPSQLAAVNDSGPESGDKTFAMTLASLELGNSQYYAKLGYQLERSQFGLAPSISQSLKDMRDAQQRYQQALEQQPHNLQVQRKLLKLYQKERHLLQKITA